ncbi:NB-ARC domain-containing protein [Nocardia sp. NPDC127579]|uniref:NB-ARC domain-containing protein n=1 Tax=Nocardia sp. NPDC127579 TaxID=3345402 RepID=UPI00362835D8
MIASRSNLLLPERNSRFINHERLLRQATAHALGGGSGNRTIVLTGGPGCGKTAAGVELAHRLSSRYLDGSLYFEFSGDTRTPDSISDVLRWALVELGVPGDSIPDHPEARRAKYRALTTEGSYVVFLDGVVSEHQVRALQPGAGSSVVLVTEARPVTPIDAAGGKLFVVESLSEDTAVQVFAGLAGAERVAAEAESAREIVRLCECLPLALSIVGSMSCSRAALRSATPLADTAARLRDEHRRRSVLSIDVVFGAAYHALSDPDRRCYRALGLFAHGGLVSAPALAAALENPTYPVEESLIELADNHLIQPVGENHYTVRSLVAQHAREVDDRSAVERAAEEKRLLDYYDERILAANGWLGPSRPWLPLLFPEIISAAGDFADSAAARAWLKQEQRSLRAAVDYATDRYPELLIRWCVALWPFHEKERTLDDLQDLHHVGIAATQQTANPLAEAILRVQLGLAHLWLNDFTRARGEFEAALRHTNHPEVCASALEGLGLAQLAGGRNLDARESLRRNRELADAIGIPRRIALACFHLAKAEAAAEALPLLATAAALFAEEPEDETENLAKVQYWRGRKLTELDEFDTATTELESALSVMTSRRRIFDQGEICTALGEVATRQANRISADQWYRQAEAAYAELGRTDLVAAVHARLSS